MKDIYSRLADEWKISRQQAKIWAYALSYSNNDETYLVCLLTQDLLREVDRGF